MKSSAVIHSVETCAVPLLEPTAWRSDLLERIGAGMRIVTVYGRRPGRGADERVVLTAVLQGTDGSLQVSRCSVAVEAGYHEMTGQVPALHCFERELHEQTGVRIARHPWLKPIRFEGRQQSDMNDYPFYKIEGKEVHEVAVGPIHAGVIEPGSFRFMCEGEQVHHLEIHLGYQHRGVERRLLEGNPRHLAPLVETIAGDTTIAHTWAYAAAVEELSACPTDVAQETVRAVALELERMGMHLATLSGLAADIGFLQGATTYGRLRTAVINATMRLCGSRFGRGMIRPGGGARLTADLRADVLATLEQVKHDIDIMNECFLDSATVRHRLQQTGVLTKDQALSLGLVGVAARASGVSLDARAAPGPGIYETAPIAPMLHSDGDCWGRACVRIREIDASLEWISSVLQESSDAGTPNAPHAQGRAPVSLRPSRLVIALVEGWRGEVVHSLETDAQGGLAHYKVQDPSLRNWTGLAIAVRGNEISDFPICNKSFDLSYCGNDL